jgi:hypothetical protein
VKNEVGQEESCSFVRPRGRLLLWFLSVVFLVRRWLVAVVLGGCVRVVLVVASVWLLGLVRWLWLLVLLGGGLVFAVSRRWRFVLVLLLRGAGLSLFPLLFLRPRPFVGGVLGLLFPSGSGGGCCPCLLFLSLNFKDNQKLE